MSYLLLWFSMVLGVGVTNKLAARWPGLAKTNELHQYVSILGIALGLFHGLILLGDQFMNFSLWQIIVPFSTTNYRPLAVGLGQLAFYAWAIILISFYVRRKIWYQSVAGNPLCQLLYLPGSFGPCGFGRYRCRYAVAHLGLLDHGWGAVVPDNLPSLERSGKCS